MQTFLPLPSTRASARVLDRQRLGKQRVEVLQVLKALTYGGGWANHPAVRMWEGHERFLVWYGLVVCTEWVSRGYKDTCYEKIAKYDTYYLSSTTGPPEWWGRADFHASHRSNLLRKDPDHYGQFGWTEDATLPYVWP